MEPSVPRTTSGSALWPRAALFAGWPGVIGFPWCRCSLLGQSELELVANQPHVFRRGHFQRRDHVLDRCSKRCLPHLDKMMSVYWSFTLHKAFCCWKWKSKLPQLFHIILFMPQSKDSGQVGVQGGKWQERWSYSSLHQLQGYLP